MKPAIVPVALVLATGLSPAPDPPQRVPDPRAGDLAAIESLHRADVAATLAYDPEALAALWTEDAVRMEPGGPAEVGRAAIHAADVAQKAQNPGGKVLTYAPTIEDVQITGDWAIEWGYFDSSYQRSPEDRPVRFRGKLLRALKRLPDGSWRFARVMWNEDKSTAG